MPLTPGATFERYEIQSLIGRGGMGEVYRALDTRLHRAVALKVLRTDKDASATVVEAGGVARLLREARAAAALNHPNSVAIYELGEAEGIAYIAMELVTGRTFRRYLGEGNVALETKVSWLVDAARALWAAHKAGLVHRDVKPGNIMVSEDGVVKVLDFGLAKPVATVGKQPEFQTQMGQVLGTPRYMAPEQLEGSPADASGDQFAFGLTAYELISGVYPGGPLAGTPPPLNERFPSASPELGRAVARMMARHTKDRFPTMEAAAHALRACVGQHPPQTVREKLQRSSDEHADSRRPSNAPTAVVAVAVDIAEPVSAEREVQQQGEVQVRKAAAKGATLPLGIAVAVAIGDSRNHTMPLALPMGQPSLSQQPPSMQQPPPDRGSDPSINSRAPSNPGLPAAPSGVYSARSQAEVHPATLRTTVGARYGAPPARRPSAARTWILIVVLLVTAIAVSVVAALLLR